MGGCPKNFFRPSVRHVQHYITNGYGSPMQTTSWYGMVCCTWPYVVPIGEDPAAHGHWCAFTDLYHTIPYQFSSGCVLFLPTFLGVSMFVYFRKYVCIYVAKYDARVYLVWTSLGIIFFLRSLHSKFRLQLARYHAIPMWCSRLIWTVL